MPEPAVPTRWQRWREVILLKSARSYTVQKYRNSRFFWRIYGKEKEQLIKNGVKPTFRKTLAETLMTFARYAVKHPKPAAAYVASSFIPFGFLMRLALPHIPRPEDQVLLKKLAVEQGKRWSLLNLFRRRGEQPAAATTPTQSTLEREIPAVPISERKVRVKARAASAYNRPNLVQTRRRIMKVRPFRRLI